MMVSAVVGFKLLGVVGGGGGHMTSARGVNFKEGPGESSPRRFSNMGSLK